MAHVHPALYGIEDEEDVIHSIVMIVNGALSHKIAHDHSTCRYHTICCVTVDKAAVTQGIRGSLRLSQQPVNRRK